MSTPGSHISLSPTSFYESPPPSPVDLVPRPQTPSEHASQHSESISISSASSYASTVCLVPTSAIANQQQPRSISISSASSRASTVCLVPTSPLANQRPAECKPEDYPSLFLPHLFRPLAVEKPSRHFKAPRLPPASKLPPPGSPPLWMLAKKRSYDDATRGTTRSYKLAALAEKRKWSGPLGIGGATKWRKRDMAKRRRQAKEGDVEVVTMRKRVF